MSLGEACFWLRPRSCLWGWGRLHWLHLLLRLLSPLLRLVLLLPLLLFNDVKGCIRVFVHGDVAGLIAIFHGPALPWWRGWVVVLGLDRQNGVPVVCRHSRCTHEDCEESSNGIGASERAVALESEQIHVRRLPKCGVKNRQKKFLSSKTNPTPQLDARRRRVRTIGARRRAQAENKRNSRYKKNPNYAEKSGNYARHNSNLGTICGCFSGLRLSQIACSSVLRFRRYRCVSLNSCVRICSGWYIALAACKCIACSLATARCRLPRPIAASSRVTRLTCPKTGATLLARIFVPSWRRFFTAFVTP
eukprot:m.215163 g.215163  ORF g.215163 m.215163 type:complete len:305 (-) comp10775_c0_seq8:400-1314(-)